MISALVTIYNPSEIYDNIKRISKQVDRLFLCDNSPNNNSLLFKGIDNMVYVYNCGNLGLSRAFNVVLKNSSYNWEDDDFIIFFDQDSQINPNHICRLVKEYLVLESQGYRVGNIGPIYYDYNINKYAVPKVKRQVSNSDYIVPSVITSSMLCKYGVLKAVNFWNEEVFLDFADWDLCFRMRENGYVSVKTKAVIFNHALGEGEKKIGVINIGKSAPIREYYQTRDALYLLRKRYTPLRYKIRFLNNVTFRPVLHALFLGHRKERMSYIKAGYCDYNEGYFAEYRSNKQ